VPALDDTSPVDGDAPADDAASRVPTIDGLLRPVLDALADGETRDMSDVVEIVADQLDLDPASRNARIASGATMIANRVGWARTSLARAGLIDQPRESAIAITDAGRMMLATVNDVIDHAYLRDTCPGYAHWLADMGGELPENERDDSDSATVWMVRAGRAGAFAPAFIEGSAVIVGWGAVGDVTGLSREAILNLVKTHFADKQGNQRTQTANTLYRFANTMRDGDLIVTPEPASRTILFGWVAGAYEYLETPVGTDQQHQRGVRWFARVPRDELSYGARNTLGSLLTLTRPSHEIELFRVAEAHANDAPPIPLTQPVGRQSAPDALAQRVPIPSNAEVPRGTALAEFQTFPRRLVDLLSELDSGQLALPDFQRSFVWAPDATRELLVSMIRSFPAGALLFLQGGSSTFKARPAEEAPDLKIAPSYLVLDGQQRLTSLYQALYGLGQSRFFLDVGALIAGSDINEAVRVFSAEKAAPLESLEAQADALMMPLAAARESGASRWRDKVVEIRKDDEPENVRNVLRDIENAYIEPLVQYRFPVTVLPQATELEAVCTIFETLNRTGKPLTPFELISARAFAGGHSLYDLWSTALEQHPVLADFAIEPYYLLQIIALRLGVSCKRSSVLSLAADDIASQWEQAVSDMAAAVSLLRDECGVLISKWLPYRPMLIPLAAAWRELASALGPEEGAMRGKLKRWFWCSCFTGEYESSSASLAERDAPLLRSWLAGDQEPPVVVDFEWDTTRWRGVTARQQGLYRSTIALTLTQHPRDFHTGAPLTQDTIEAGKVDDHHIFPRGYLAEQGRGSDIDCVLNHCLIDRATNIRIGKKAPSAYLAEIRAALGSDLDQVLASQLLPPGENSPLSADDFDGLLSWRLERLSDMLAEEAGRVGTTAADLDPQQARLDARITAVELQLRQIILDGLSNDASLIPTHLIQKVDERIAAAARRYPGGTSTHDPTLAEKLEYFDVRDLQETLTAKALWSYFEPVFRTKETLNARFGQLAELRNTVRHSRTANEVTTKDGEAALLWFAQIFAALDRGPSASGLTSSV
jgi:hypothetical protein